MRPIAEARFGLTMVSVEPGGGRVHLSVWPLPVNFAWLRTV